MSKDISFSKVHPIKEDLPDIVNVNSKDFLYSYVPEDRAEEWQKKVGIKRTIRYRTVDMFGYCEKKYGKRASSMRSSWRPDRYECYTSDGEYLGTVSKEELDKASYEKEAAAYIYQAEEIGSLDSAYILKENDGQILTRYMIDHIIDEYVDYIGDSYDGYVPQTSGEDLYLLLKIRRLVFNKEDVVMEIG